MKQLYVLMVALFAFCSASAQTQQPCSSCLPAGITFTTQAQIDNFQTNYPNCTEIEGNVTIDGYQSINNLNGLSQITYIGGSLTTTNNWYLSSLSDLENLTYVGGLYLTLSAYPNLNGLNGLTSVGGNVTIIDNNYFLSSLTGLDNLASIGGNLWISACDALQGLSGLENLTFIEGDLVIDIMYLPNLNGLNGLTSVGGDVKFSFVNSINSMTGLENLHSIGGGLYLTNNYELTSLAGLAGLDSLGGTIRIEHNPALTTLTGLEGLSYIPSALTIMNNASLTNLSGLEGLDSIGGNLTIGWFGDGNPSLTTLMALEGLTSIGGHLRVIGNVSLTSLAGINNIEEGSIIDLFIADDTLLTTCDVQSICEYLVSPNGNITIQNNSQGCNNAEEVIATCGVGIEDNPNPENQIIIYPNPSSTQITISTPATLDKNTFMTIYNINGQVILSRQITEEQTVVDVGTLARGVYFVRVSNDRTVQVGKFVKQ